MKLSTTAGTRLFIGGVKEQKNVDFAEADFTAEVWVEIGGMENFGSNGDASEEVPINLVAERRTKVLKGPRRAASMEILAGLDLSDAGQLALIAAEKSEDDYAFKIEFDDAPATGVDPTPSQRLFIAKVMNATEQLNEAGNVKRLASTLAINSNMVRVAATAGA